MSKLYNIELCNIILNCVIHKDAVFSLLLEMTTQHPNTI